MSLAVYIYTIACFILAAGLSWHWRTPPYVNSVGLAALGAWLQFFVVLYLVLSHGIPGA